MDTFELISRHIGESDPKLITLIELAYHENHDLKRKVKEMENRILSTPLRSCREALREWRHELREERGHEAEELANLLLDIHSEGKTATQLTMEVRDVIWNYDVHHGCSLPGWISHYALKKAIKRTHDRALVEAFNEARS